jgi:hypothetical protein
MLKAFLYNDADNGFRRFLAAEKCEVWRTDGSG